MVRRVLLLACVLFCLLAAVAVARNPTTRPMDLERYDLAMRCVKHSSPGALALQSWLQGHVRGVSWGILRCEKLSKRNYSLHAEGRAVDWHLDVHDRRDRRAAKRLIGRLLAPDWTGNPHALARRMGVQEIIWNCRSWWAGSGGMERYSACFDRRGRRKRRLDDTVAHRNHVHLGLNRAGARMQASFWRR